MKLTEILKIKGDWQEVIDDCRSTVGKEPLGKDPSEKFKKGILISEHSPIRDLIVRWRWHMPSWVATHWVRHKFEKYVSTQRTDRTGIDRNKLPQDESVIFKGEANCQHTIDFSRKRLCYQAAKDTREYAEDFKISLRPIEQEWSDTLVPNCVYRCGCPEMQPCGYWEKFKKWCWREFLVDIGDVSIADRYYYYNQYFYKMKGLNE